MGTTRIHPGFSGVRPLGWRVKAMDELAKALGRDRAWIVERAVRQFLETEQQFITSVLQGQGDIEAGRFIETDHMNAELDLIEVELSGHP